MGYFSQLALVKDFYGNRPDTSFPTPVMVLKWRVTDLETRLLELRDKKSGFEGSVIPKEVIHYVLPEHLTRIEDVELAILLAKQKIDEEESEGRNEYKEEFPEERLYSPSVVIVPSAVVVGKEIKREKVNTRGS